MWVTGFVWHSPVSHDAGWRVHIGELPGASGTLLLPYASLIIDGNAALQQWMHLSFSAKLPRHSRVAEVRSDALGTPVSLSKNAVQRKGVGHPSCSTVGTPPMPACNCACSLSIHADESKLLESRQKKCISSGLTKSQQPTGSDRLVSHALSQLPMSFCLQLLARASSGRKHAPLLQALHVLEKG